MAQQLEVGSTVSVDQANDAKRQLVEEEKGDNEEDAGDKLQQFWALLSRCSACSVERVAVSMLISNLK